MNQETRAWVGMLEYARAVLAVALWLEAELELEDQRPARSAAGKTYAPEPKWHSTVRGLDQSGYPPGYSGGVV